MAAVRRSLNFLPRRRPTSRGRGMAKILSARGGHYLHLQTQFGEDRCMQIPVIMVTDPQTHTQTNPQTGPITIHCTAKLSAQCKKERNLLHKLPFAQTAHRH